MLDFLFTKVYAEAPKITPAGDLTTTKNAESVITNVSTNVINILLLIGGILAVLYVIWAGIQYITSAGNADRAKQARAGIVNGIIGVVIIVAAYAIVRFAVAIGGTIASST